MTELTDSPIPLETLLPRVRRDHCGAAVLFVGTVRDLTGEDRTEALTYEAYAPMALRQMERIEADLRGRYPIGELLMVHRLGTVAVGEAAVAVAVSCPHRQEAFAACAEAMDRLKQAVPIWKRDHAPGGGGQWVHPGAETEGGRA